MAVWLLLTLAAYGYGAALLRTVTLDGWQRKLSYRLALGYGALAYLVLAVGLLGRLGRGAGWALLAVGWGLALPALRREAASLRHWRAKTAATRVSFDRETRLPHVLDGESPWPELASVLVLLALALVGLFVLLIALAPPVGYDELTYHLAAPKVFVRTGVVSILPYDHHTAFSFTLEMLYTLGLLLGGTASAKLVHVAFWGLSLLTLGWVGRDYLGPRVGWLAVSCFAFTPLTLTHAPLAYTEFGLTVYSLLALASFLDYLNVRATSVSLRAGQLGPTPRQPRWLWVCGVCCGLCYGIKATAALLPLYLVAAQQWLGWADGLSVGTRVRHKLTLLGVTALVACPWVLRTWVATGNPVFPFAHGAFHSRLWSDDRAKSYDEAQKAFGRPLDESLRPVGQPGAHRRLSQLPLAPWRATLHPDWFFDIGLNFDGKAQLGPAWLGLGLPALALWLVAWRRRRRCVYEEVRDETVSEVFSREHGREVSVARTRGITERVTVDTALVLTLLWGWLLLSGLFWFATMQYLRYLAPWLAWWALATGWAADGLLRLRVSRLATGVLLVVQVVGALAYQVPAGFPALQVALGGLEPERYAARGVPAYDAMQWLNANCPQAKTILFGEPRAYWLDGPYLWGERNHSTLIGDDERRDLDSYLAALRRLGVTHALIAEGIFPVDQTAGHDDVALVGQAIAAGKLVRVWRDPNERKRVSVYALR